MFSILLLISRSFVFESGFFVLCSDKEFEEARKEGGALKQRDEKRILDAQVGKKEQRWLLARENSNQDNYIPPPWRELPLHFCSLQQELQVAWWIGSC